MNELQDHVRAWLKRILDETGLSASALARKIGTSTTTITRLLNDPTHKAVLSHRTIDAIVRVTGLSGPYPSRIERLVQKEDIDAIMLPKETGDTRVDDAIRYLCQTESALVPWRLNTHALEGLGYLPGDVMIVDMNATAETGDVVVAQLYAQNTRTVFRQYVKPFLTAEACDRVARQPILVDEMNAQIRGVVVATFRSRRGHAGHN